MVRSPTRVVLVVKYFPPFPRISGVLTFVALLASELGRHVELHVVTSELPDRSSDHEIVPNCTIHRVGWPFPLSAAREVARLRPSATIAVSGIYDLDRAAVYFASIVGAAKRRGRCWLYQATWPNGRPGAMYRVLAGRTDGLLVASEGIAELMAQSGLTASVIEPAIDLASLQQVSRRRRPTPATAPLRVGFVNHLNEVKGADIALAAMDLLSSRHPEMRFAVAGLGDLRDELMSRYGSLPGAGFEGFVKERQRLDLLASCDVLLLPFRQAESVLGVSQTALEAMALGTVVIGSDTKSLSGAIVSEENGLLLDVDHLDAAELATAVDRLNDDRGELERLRGVAEASMTLRWAAEARVQELLGLICT